MTVIRELETQLEKRGQTSAVRESIHSAKICIIDDNVKHLSMFIQGLKDEGFTHIVEKSYVDSVNDILVQNFDLIVLDISGVASEKFSEDGIGILKALKNAEPTLLVLVVTGASTDAEMAKNFELADVVRKKPIKTGDLAHECEGILLRRKDEFWAAISILKEIEKIPDEERSKLSCFQKFRLFLFQQQIVNTIRNYDPNVVDKMLKIAHVVTSLGKIGLNIVKIAGAFGK